MTIPSNSPSPNNDNTVSKFRAYFQTPIELDGEYEVALRELHVPRRFVEKTMQCPLEFLYVYGSNVRRYQEKVSPTVPLPSGEDDYDSDENVEMIVTTRYPTAEEMEGRESKRFQNDQIEIPIRGVLAAKTKAKKGNENVYLPILIEGTEYESVKHLVKAIDKAIMLTDKEHMYLTSLPSISIDEGDFNRVVIKPGMTYRNEPVFPLLSHEFRRLLGIDDLEEPYENLQNNEQLIKGNVDPQFNLERFFIFAYTNIIRPSYCGNTMAQLLRVIELPRSEKELFVSHRFSDTYYMPLASSSFADIEIQLAHDTGELVNFRGGRSLAILHFRKIIKETNNNRNNGLTL